MCVEKYVDIPLGNKTVTNSTKVGDAPGNIAGDFPGDRPGDPPSGTINLLAFTTAATAESGSPTIHFNYFEPDSNGYQGKMLD